MPIEISPDGHPCSVHVCETCGVEFTVAPPAEVFRNCMAPDCPSYDPDHDLDWIEAAIRLN